MHSPSLPSEKDQPDLSPLELSQTGTADSEKPDFMEVDGSLSEGLESVENFALKFGSRVEVLVGNCMRFGPVNSTSCVPSGASATDTGSRFSRLGRHLGFIRETFF